MPSINSPQPLTIAFRRAEMRAFWILTTAVLSLGLAFAAAVFGARAPWAWGLVGLALPLPSLIWPRWLEYGVRAWNKGIRSAGAILRAYVLRVAYYLLFVPVGSTGSSLDPGARSGDVSRWILRARHEAAVRNGELVAAADRSWGSELLASVRSQGQPWQMCLIPVLVLLLVLRDEGQESALPSSTTYTLY